MAKPYDIVVFGATGYTGRWVMEYLTKGNRGGLKWAAAARDSAKLDQTLDSVSKIVGVDLKASVDKIICDVKDELSMLGMAEKASVVLNCVGPYRWAQCTLQSNARVCDSIFNVRSQGPKTSDLPCRARRPATCKLKILQQLHNSIHSSIMQLSA